MRAGLSTRREFCNHLVSAGAGLPTQRVSEGLLVVWNGHGRSGGVGGNLSFELLELERRHRPKVGLHRPHLRADLSFELGSFSRCHRFEEESYLLHPCFGSFWRS